MTLSASICQSKTVFCLSEKMGRVPKNDNGVAWICLLFFRYQKKTSTTISRIVTDACVSEIRILKKPAVKPAVKLMPWRGVVVASLV